jgi:hypothetical protein
MLLLALLLCPPLLAQDKVADAPIGSPSRIAPFFSGHTFVVVRADLSKIDPAATEQWVKDIAKVIQTDPKAQEEQLKQFQGVSAQVKSWLAEFKKAGGEQLYVVVAFRDGEMVPLTIAPIEEGDDAPALQRLLTPQDQQAADVKMATAVMHNAVVLGPANQLEALRTGPRGDTKDVDQALADGKDAAVQIVFVPTKALLPLFNPDQLPKGLDGQALAKLPEQMRWMSLTLTAPPKFSTQLTVQARDNAVAQQMAEQINNTLKALRQDENVKKEVHNLTQLTQMLTPKVEGERLTVRLTQDDVNTLLRQDPAPVKAVDIPKEEQK